MLFMGWTGGMGCRGGVGRKGKNGWMIGIGGALALSRPSRLSCPSRPSMSHRLAVAAMVAANCRLDQAAAVRITAGDEREPLMAAVRPKTTHRCGFDRLRVAMTSNRVPHHRAEFLFRDLHPH